MSGELIMVRCEGSNCPPAGHVLSKRRVTEGSGLCSMCGIPQVLLEGVAPEHDRLDVIAMLNRGDFDRAGTVKDGDT